jgi:hypothetical protein
VIRLRCSEGKTRNIRTCHYPVSFQFCRRLIAMNPGDTSEIRWHTVPHAEWNAKSGHVIHKNFNKLVKGVPNGKQMPMQGEAVLD